MFSLNSYCKSAATKCPESRPLHASFCIMSLVLIFLQSLSTGFTGSVAELFFFGYTFNLLKLFFLMKLLLSFPPANVISALDYECLCIIDIFVYSICITAVYVIVF